MLVPGCLAGKVHLVRLFRKKLKRKERCKGFCWVLVAKLNALLFLLQ